MDQDSVNKKLQKDQAALSSKRRTTEQTFKIRDILKQANGWRVGLYMHFVNRESFSKIFIRYGILGKMTRLIADIHQGFESVVINGSEISDLLKIKTRVKLGYMMLLRILSLIGHGLDQDDGKGR